MTIIAKRLPQTYDAKFDAATWTNFIITQQQLQLEKK
jgi:hypothetical protein